ncbi:hypothetical protein SGB_02528 [Shigella boydii ATCC 9905]|nr:hypothetical protein SGB_04209 [Shigella boydii ATCC 9905]EFW55224.1 hypothetical protein SGB_02528 [Shigella boydii ATCC 9905]
MLLSVFLWLKKCQPESSPSSATTGLDGLPHKQNAAFFVELLALDNVNFLAVPA